MFTENWPPVDADVWQLPANWTSSSRLHSAMVFLFPRRGQLTMETARGETTVGTEQVALARSNIRYCLHTDAPSEVLLLRMRTSAFGLNIQADADAWDLLMALARWSTSDGPMQTLSSPGARSIRHALECILREQRDRLPGWRAMVKAAGFDILTRIARCFDPPELLTGKPLPRVSQGLREVFEFVESHYDEVIRIADLARRAHLSRSHFHAVFQAQAGMSPAEYVTRVRIGQACRLLRETDRTVLDIALSCGFGSASRFYEAFGQALGRPPTQWRSDRRQDPTDRPANRTDQP